MDNLRGTFDSGIPADESQNWDADTSSNEGAPEEENVRDLPPEAIGQDERRMQVRAYNHWASLLGDATFPSIEELEPENLPDFGPNSVLLDFSSGIEDPSVQYLGDKLAEECGAVGTIGKLSDVPPRSLLSRITDHYMQILANQAPIGFEAEFVNQRGASILYRGILLPFSSDLETIDFIYGVINWKEAADAATADELLLEIDQALELDDEEPVEDEDQPQKHHADPVTDWADSPSHEPAATDVPQINPIGESDAREIVPDIVPDNVALFAGNDDDGEDGSELDENGLPLPDFGQYSLDDPEVDEFGEEIEEEDEGSSSYSFASLTDHIEAPVKKAIDLDADRFDPDDYRVEDGASDAVEIGDEPVDLPVSEPMSEPVPEPVSNLVPVAVPEDFAPVESDVPVEEPIAECSEDAGLHDCLASARELAHTARASEDRSRQALYAAVGRAYDFSLAAQDEPEAYQELIEDSGLSVQERAPMTPVVKLVFGHDYDKTRLTEYAAVLSHAHRVGLERGALATFLAEADGGLKGVVNAERRLRREESGEQVEEAGDIRAKLAQKLRELEALSLEALAGEGPEFSLAVLRRDEAGNVSVIGEVGDDAALTERVAKKLAG
ncbi:hypothetical protein [uncultured Erythrobacter sp.]|uniref:PAS domain-containing protein n=1 Tax=uncultured Erythrobacter sp. TaxID=263913 RepID=UPI00262DDBA1|nr:hypothetical protein [uncultured Erythrobacter sp.]